MKEGNLLLLCTIKATSDLPLIERIQCFVERGKRDKWKRRKFDQLRMGRIYSTFVTNIQRLAVQQV